MQTCNKKVVNKLLYQAILIYGMTVESIAQWSVKNQEQPNLLLYSVLNTATHTPGHVINAPHLPHFLLLSCIIQIKKLRRPGTWLILFQPPLF